MQLYFDSQASGGGNNQDFGDLNNYWQDASRTVPNGSLPISSDDVQLYDNVIICNNIVGLNHLTDSGSHSFSPANQAVTIFGNATGINFVPGGIFSGTITAIGCTFTGDVADIIGSGTCIYSANISHNITDDGTGNWGNHIGYIFSGTIVSAGTIASEGCTFSGSVTADTITIDQVNTGGSTFTGPVTVTTIAGTLSGGPSYVSTFTNTVTCVGAASINQAAFSGSGTIVFSNITTSIAVGTIYSGYNPFSPFTIQFPSINNVYTTIPINIVNSVSGPSGILTIPAQADVKSGVVYGVGGNGSTGTLVSSGGTTAYVG